MKSKIALLVALLATLFVVSSMAQAPSQKTVTLTWIDDANPAGTTYSVYRATGLCSGTPTWSKIATAVSSKSYDDATVMPGNYCYQVTATYNGVESSPSPTALAPVPSFAPTQLQLTIK